MKKSKSANHRLWYLQNKDFMKKQKKKKSHKKEEYLKAEKQEIISEKSRKKNNILDKNKNIEEITENNIETSSHEVYNWEKFLQHFDLYIDD